jgi:hypothetical protein
MVQGLCRLSECTFNVTGACVLNRPVEQCSNRSDQNDTAADIEKDDEADEGVSATAPSTAVRFSADLGSAVLVRPEETPRLPSSLTMGIEEATSLMTRRHTTMVGILGLPILAKPPAWSAPTCSSPGADSRDTTTPTALH